MTGTHREGGRPAGRWDGERSGGGTATGQEEGGRAAQEEGQRAARTRGGGPKRRRRPPRSEIPADPLELLPQLPHGRIHLVRHRLGRDPHDLGDLPVGLPVEA